jgi:hypothetical protein
MLLVIDKSLRYRKYSTSEKINVSICCLIFVLLIQKYGVDENMVNM